MKPKKYGSAKRLGEAWLQNQIQGEAIATKGSYVLTANSKVIWNGYRGQVLILRNPNFPFVIALRESAASLGREAETVIKGALGLLSDPFMTGISPVPFVKINSLADPSLLSCDLAALQPLVLESVTQTLEYEMHRHRRNPKRDNSLLENVWKGEGTMLGLVDLQIPQDLETKKNVIYNIKRLVGAPWSRNPNSTTN
jgi:hypothetical protein